MLRRVLLDIAMVLGSILILGVAWVAMSVIVCMGTSLLLIVDPSMTTREMINISAAGGWLGVGVALVAAVLKGRRDAEALNI